MTKGKKYHYQITQIDSAWRAEIVRQVTSKKTVISKFQDGFDTEADAKVWAETQLTMFLESLKEKNKRRSS